MKKHTVLLLFLYAIIAILSIIYIIFDSLGLDIELITSNQSIFIKFIFSTFSVIISLTFFLLIVWFIMDEYSKRQLNNNLRRIINNKPIGKQSSSELGNNISHLSHKMKHLVANLQRTENAYIQNSEEIVKKERHRIARDLHDTVSQELFASAMILSGVSQNIDQLDKENLKNQLLTVESILTDAQNDLRVMLLHLRPTELEDKTLSEGFAMILQELTDKSGIKVVYKENIKQLPKAIEDNLFRIAQEFISNTLKHAKASQLEVYLNQKESEVQLKMVDNGQGFDVDQARSLSYGLKNIEERVDDLAGTLDIKSAKGKGVSMDIRMPLMQEGEQDE
ncbi:sensor histidine kinase [Streptococcus sp. CSL10205-OR2]|uniref:sensor histidine kinase n=1 Tax=Streptococcus sp. CSL10205-OR2 TaxID=2980558 RepID=UPI0021DA79AB|nr:sensor histidine kinase [Streptococcus sp. CSL10205-OR2]MCU9533496.1 sensor histidine kinase [Streptococcus sp. CSL10205-OR2]